ncbi:RNA 2',3'-cyclic phosphodiesterase [Patescibacteria group bacterium]|nr:RNA 2',3'-cyclic phosphodiesterase [Patescibacteria group bacterium]
MRRRIFVAINLPEKAKKRLKEFQEKYDYLPVRWTKENSLHLTLVFVGYVSDEQMLEICRVSREKAAKCEPFFINFKRIILGPPNKPPRMIWVEGEISQELSNLKNLLEDAFLKSDSGFRYKEMRLIKPHITLARIKMDRWRQLEPKPEINEEFQAQVPVSSIEVMESDLRSDGAEYVILESCSLES